MSFRRCALPGINRRPPPSPAHRRQPRDSLPAIVRGDADDLAEGWVVDLLIGQRVTWLTPLCTGCGRACLGAFIADSWQRDSFARIDEVGVT